MNAWTAAIFIASAYYLQPLPPASPSALSLIQDLEFAEAQEDFVRAALRPTAFFQILPPADCKRLRRLGCPTHECREDAEQDLYERATAANPFVRDAARRAILWARRSTDPEVRDRAEKLWQSLFCCPDCRGAGGRWATDAEIRNDWDDGWRVCERCWGHGDLRWVARPTPEAVE